VLQAITSFILCKAARKSGADTRDRMAIPEDATTDSHDTFPACVREGPAPAAPPAV
jgi:hypothetical protein